MTLQRILNRVRMRFVPISYEQQNRLRMLVDAIGQQTASIRSRHSGRCTEQTRDGGDPVLRMSKRMSSTPSEAASCFGNFRLADTGRAGERRRSR